MTQPLFRDEALDAAATGAGAPSAGGRARGWFRAARRAPRVPLVLQVEAAECGLACLAMVAGAHGLATDLALLRQRFPVSAHGSTLAELMRCARELGFVARPLRAELAAIGTLARPCVLHWDFDHFVVLVDWHDGVATLNDPARGRVQAGADELSKRFTGVALELMPAPGFEPRDERVPLGLRELVGPVPGFGRALAGMAALALGLEALVLAGPLLLQWTVDRVLPAADRGLLVTLGLGFAGLVLLQVAFAAARAVVVVRLSTRLVRLLSQRVFAHLVRLPLAWFERRRAGDVASRFASVQQVQGTLTTGFVEGAIDGVLVVATFAVMLATHPPLALLAAGVGALYGLLRWRGLRALRGATEAALVAEARQGGHFLETLRGIAAIRLANAEAAREARFAQLVADAADADFAVARLQLRHGLVQRGLFGLERVAVVCLGAAWVLAGELTLGALFAFIAWREVFAQRIAALVDQAVEWRLLRVAIDRLADVVRAPVDEPAAPGPGVLAPRTAVTGTPAGAPSPAEARAPWIVCEGLRFRHAPGEPEVLAGLDLAIERGESVAIVGVSGAGKTTLVKLLLGLHEPTAGRIVVGGVPLQALGRARWRAQVGAVLQDDTLFAGTLAENIAFFEPAADAGWIVRCAEQAGIHEEIARLPMGYATRVGDLGVALSGGQRQRVLLARALYRRPAVLVLDEATSALDAESERGVAAALRALPLTRILVAHRAETIASAGRVVTLAEGRVVAETRRERP